MIAWAAYEHLRGPAHCVPAAEVALADGMPDVPHSLVMPVSLLPQLRFIPKWPLGTDEGEDASFAEEGGGGAGSDFAGGTHGAAIAPGARSSF